MTTRCRCGGALVASAIRGDLEERTFTTCTQCKAVVSPIACRCWRQIRRGRSQDARMRCGAPATNVCHACGFGMCEAHAHTKRPPRCSRCQRQIREVVHPVVKPRRTAVPVEPYWARD